MAEGNGDVANDADASVKEEPMEEIATVEDHEEHSEDVIHTEDYKKLIEYGLNENVADKLDEIYRKGKLAHADLDERALDALRDFPVDGALVVLKQFLESNLEHVSNKSAFLCGVMKTYRQKSKLPTSPSPATLKGPDEEKIKAILERTGYALDVTTGQRKYGGPPPNGGSSPGSGCEVFVGKIPKDIYEDELIPLFEKCGKIWDLRLMMDPMSGQNRGFAFVTFCEHEGAIEATKQLDNYEIKKGKTLKVNISVPNLRLFVGNIPKSKSKEEIFDEFMKLAAGLTDVIIYSSPNENKKNRGFCFLEYESHKTASLAKRRLGSGRVKVWGCDIIVDWADPQEEPDQETMSKVKVLYVRNLTNDVSEEKLKELFEPFGKVERVKKIKDYAFIHYDERDNAMKAMNELNGKDMNGITMEVSLAKPPSDKKKKEEQIRARERRMLQVHHGMMMMPPPPPPARGRGMRGPMNRDYDYDYNYCGYTGGYTDYRGGYSDPCYDEYYPYEDYYDYGFAAPGPRSRGRAGFDRGRGRGGPALRGRIVGPQPRGRGIMNSRGVSRGVRAGGRGGAVGPRGRGNLAGKRKFDGGHQNQGDSKRRYQNSMGGGNGGNSGIGGSGTVGSAGSNNWGSRPIAQQPLDIDGPASSSSPSAHGGFGGGESNFGGVDAEGASGSDQTEWYQDSYGQDWS